MGIFYVVGAGSFDETSLPAGKGDYIVAADGGYAYLQRLGMVPDMVLGDFDSLGRVPEHPNVIRHRPEKNDTDMMLAVRTGLERGYRRFALYGSLGGRLDHTAANLQTLTWLARRGAEGFLVGREVVWTGLPGGVRLRFTREHKGTISVFSAGDEARGVYLRGLKYPLTDALLTCDVPLGVSNEFTGGESSVSAASGVLLIQWGRGEADLPANGFGTKREYFSAE